MHDIVCPKDNEKELISMAIKLGYNGVCLVYDSAGKLIKNKDLLKEIGLKLHFGLSYNSEKKIHDIVVARASGKSRAILERKEADIIYDFENSMRQDYIHHR